MDRRAVIIGAGITGTLLGWQLVRAGWKVVLLEAAHVGAGSSSRTAAGIRQQFSTPETVLGMRYSVDFYRRFREEVGGDEVPIVQNGYLFLYALQEDWDAARMRVRMQHACGLGEVEALEAGALAFPAVRTPGGGGSDRDDVAMQRDIGVLGRDEESLRCRSGGVDRALRCDQGVATGAEGDSTDDQALIRSAARGVRQRESVAWHATQCAGAEEQSNRVGEGATAVSQDAERAGKARLVRRPVARGRDMIQDGLAKGVQCRDRS